MLSALAAIGLSGLKVEDLHKLRGTDSWEEELIVMAETAAYFHVSYKVRRSPSGRTFEAVC